jgi:hypothetical protein
VLLAVDEDADPDDAVVDLLLLQAVADAARTTGRRCHINGHDRRKLHQSDPVCW